MLYIYTDAIRTGKTTHLLRLVSNLKNYQCISSGGLSQSEQRHSTDIIGFLAVDNEQTGLRELYDVYTGDYDQYQISASEAARLSKDEVLTIGKFNFLVSAMQKCNTLVKSGNEDCKKLIFFDEIGKLELAGTGLAELVKYLLEIEKNDTHGIAVVFIVRDYLVDQVRKHFDFSSDTVILRRTEDDIDKLFGTFKNYL